MRALLVVLLLAASGCQQQPADNIDLDVLNLAKVIEPVDVAPVQVVASATFEARPTPPLAARARTTTLADPLAIQFDIELDGATGGELALELVMPDGTPYGRDTRAVVEAPYDTQQFSFTLPVAGTWIEAHSLYGDWSAHLLLGTRELLSEPFTLTLTP